jgi:hypothetical protein
VTVVWALCVLWAIACLVLAAGSTRFAMRNLAEFRRARTREPLEVGEILSGEPPRSVVPDSWPSPATICQQQSAAAYRDYARERRESVVLTGELMLLTAGAGLGASLASLLRGGWHMLPAAVALLVGAFGIIIKRHGEQRWTDVARLYERRRAQLHGGPVDAELPRRRRPRWLHPWW